jgi:hypothetical protein
MTLFSDFTGSDPTIDSRNARFARLWKVGAALLGVLVVCIIFFNYLVSITRIGAGYVGVEVVLSVDPRRFPSVPAGSSSVRSTARSSSFLPSSRP